jgi:hypothetical protein
VKHPNGSIEFRACGMWVGTSAPNAFGGTWYLPHPQKLFGRGKNYLRRRGAYWMLRFESSVGWSWQQVNNGDWI